MQITFDPHNVQECATISRLLGTAAPQKWTPVNDGTPRHIRCEVTPAQPETAQPDTAQPDTAPAQPDTAQPETDCHGMTHDDAIHSTPSAFLLAGVL